MTILYGALIVGSIFGILTLMVLAERDGEGVNLPIYIFPILILVLLLSFGCNQMSKELSGQHEEAPMSRTQLIAQFQNRIL